MKFYPNEKGGAMLKGGSTQCFEVVLTPELEVLAILMGGGGAKSFHLLKGEARKDLPHLKREKQKVSDPRFSHFVVAPPPN